MATGEETDWRCLADSNADYKIFPEKLNFAGAKSRCEEEGATLGRISSVVEFEFVQTLASDDDVPDNVFYIGVEDRNEIGGDGAERFSYVDNFPDTSFFEKPKEFPWDVTQPNDAFFSFENQLCVVFQIFLDTNFFHIENRWVDEDCVNLRQFLCRRKCFSDPSNAPTDSPTLSSFPTLSPSASLSALPTGAPSVDAEVSLIEDEFRSQVVLSSILGLLCFGLVCLVVMYVKESRMVREREENLRILKLKWEDSSGDLSRYKAYN